MIKLSNRLCAVLNLLAGPEPALAGVRDYCLCDVGCDHGYVSIAAVQSGKASRVIAMDLRKGPLAKARENIAAYNLTGQIETRLSDGVDALAIGEADCVIIAGMGGETVLHILKSHLDLFESLKEFILQPQSDIDKVRRFLRDHGFAIAAEDMILEDGKFYPMMRVVRADQSRDDSALKADLDLQDINLQDLNLQDLYGPCLLRERNKVLLAYLQKEAKTLSNIEEGLKKQNHTEAIANRLKEVADQLRTNQKALEIFS